MFGMAARRRGVDLLSDLEKLVDAIKTRGFEAPTYVAQVLAGRFRAWRTQRAIDSAGDLPAKFSLIYRHRWWDKEGESASGPGSTLDFTRTFRSEFSALLRQRNFKRLFDAPCGDWNWFREMDLPSELEYEGGDVVPDLVRQLQQKYGGPSRQFEVFDITRGRFPDSDLWLCRDCLAHLSNSNVAAALRNFSRSEIPYAMLSSYIIEGPNEDIESGGFRPLDLTRPPFNLPPPELAINDWPDSEKIRYVGLWSRSRIAEAVPRFDHL